MAAWIWVIVVLILYLGQFRHLLGPMLDRISVYYGADSFKSDSR